VLRAFTCQTPFLDSVNRLMEIEAKRSLTDPLPGRANYWTKENLGTKFKAPAFFTIISVPCALVIVFVFVLLHDLRTDGATILRESNLDESTTIYDCWLTAPAVDLRLHFVSLGMPMYGGKAVQWLTIDRTTGDLDCSRVPLSPNAVWTFLVVLPVTWLIVIRSSYQIRALSHHTGVLFIKTEKLKDKYGDTCLDIILDFQKSVAKTRRNHMYYFFAFQILMFLIDRYTFQTRVRWTIFYQFVWWGFGTSLIQVRPGITYCALLSQAFVDCYIKLILDSREERKITNLQPAEFSPSWKDLAQMHHELELDISDIWIKVNTLAFVPALPFLTFSVLHFLTDKNFTYGCIISAVLLAVAGSFLVGVLMPIGNISSMFNSCAAFKGRVRSTRGSMSVTAVARSFVNEQQRTGEEDREYHIFLDYVQGHTVRVFLGLPGIWMVPITKATVTGMMWEIFFKFPFIVSLFLALRNTGFTDTGLPTS